MEDFFFNVPLTSVKHELRMGYIECQKRGLMKSAKWLSEMCFGMNDVEVDSAVDDEGVEKNIENASIEGIDRAEYDNYILAKSYFDLQEYDRSAHFTKDCQSSVPKFLHLYATYLAIEKKRLDSITDQTNLNDSGHRRDLADLLATLRASYSNSKLDGYGMYLYGVVLKALSLNQAAFQVLTQALRLVPMLWAAYVELAPLIKDKDKLLNLQLGGHWMRHFFVALTFIELYLNDESIKIYEDLQNAGFRKCLHISLQLAVTHHHKRDVDKALDIFKLIYENDPFCLDHLDLYSNLLYVKEMKTEMAQLAHKAVGINKYLPETCCVIGNYYSIRSEHQKAISYFQRALKLNPKYLSAWTLMGHEFMELKNTNAAIQSYRKAVEVNKRDYRAWYGLGQAYEILKMHGYSLYYFQNAHQLRPFDSRMLVALGETYEKLDKNGNAIRCYWKACNVGDIEGIAMYKVASLYEKLGNFEEAVHCYALYCADEGAISDKQCYFRAIMIIANYHEKKGDYERAAYYAYKCLESDDRKNEAKALLKTIENNRIALINNKGGTSETSNGNLTATQSTIDKNLANADTSSDDDMEIELNPFKSFDADDNLYAKRTKRKIVPTNSAALAIRPEILSRAHSAAALSMRDLTAMSLSLSESDLLTPNDLDSGNDNGSAGGKTDSAGGNAGTSESLLTAAADADSSNISTQTVSGETTSEATTEHTTSTISNQRHNQNHDSGGDGDGDGEDESYETMPMDISTVSMD